MIRAILTMRLSAIISILLCTIASSAHAEFVTVELQSGREFAGDVDIDSDDDNLWLRTSTDAMSIRRPIAWSQIVAASLDGRPISVDSLRETAASVATSREVIEWNDSSRDAEPAAARFIERRPIAREQRPVSIEVDAYIANWDADVETDGLIVRVTALDRDRVVVPTYGTLHVNWIATRPVGLATHNFRVGRDLGPGFLLAGKWTRQVSPTTAGTAVTEYRLPFQADHPEFDLELGSFGVVNARLAVPGVGVLNASDAMVRVRPMSTVRDARARLDRVWFFPNERTGRSE